VRGLLAVTVAVGGVHIRTPTPHRRVSSHIRQSTRVRFGIVTNSDWPPPSRRHVPPPEPSEDVSPQLHRALRGWLQQALLNVAPDMTVRPRTDYGFAVRQIMLRLGTDTPPWEFPPETILDAVHETLYQVQWLDPAQNVRELQSTLTAANSIWRVAARPDLRRGLERNVDETVTDAVSEAIRTAPQQAAEHLRAAWEAAYGRNPDPDKAFNEAVRAVEEVACPLVEQKRANAGNATLGTVIGQLGKTAPHKWELALPDTNGQPRNVAHLVGMMEDAVARPSVPPRRCAEVPTPGRGRGQSSGAAGRHTRPVADDKRSAQEALTV